MDLLEDGLNFLDAQRVTFLSRKVVYQRGSHSVEVNATPGKTIFDLDGEFGISERFETRDYLVSTAELVLDGVLALPRRGDLIRETVTASVFIYEVMAPGKEPEWRYCDPFRKTLRIHTKLVSTEDA